MLFTDSGRLAAPELFLRGASQGKKSNSEGAKNQKNLPKMADFGYFFLLMGGISNLLEPPMGGGMPPMPIPLDVATVYRM